MQVFFSGNGGFLSGEAVGQRADRVVRPLRRDVEDAVPYRKGEGAVRSGTHRMNTVWRAGKAWRFSGSLSLPKNLHGHAYRREGYHRLARANTPDSVSFRRFLPFSSWLAPASRRLKKQKSLENTSLPDAEQFCRSRNVSRQGKTRREYLPYCQGA